MNTNSNTQGASSSSRQEASSLSADENKKYYVYKLSEDEFDRIFDQPAQPIQSKPPTQNYQPPQFVSARELHQNQQQQQPITTEQQQAEKDYIYYSDGEPYTEKNEKLLREYLDHSRVQSAKHYKKAKKLKLYHRVFGLPSMLIPLIYSPIAAFFKGEDGIDVATVCVLVTTAIFSGTTQFFNFSEKSQKHFEFEAKYADLITTINGELLKQRNYRIPASRFIAKVHSDFDHYGATAPDL